MSGSLLSAGSHLIFTTTGSGGHSFKETDLERWCYLGRSHRWEGSQDFSLLPPDSITQGHNHFAMRQVETRFLFGNLRCVSSGYLYVLFFLTTGSFIVLWLFFSFLFFSCSFCFFGSNYYRSSTTYNGITFQ